MQFSDQNMGKSIYILMLTIITFEISIAELF